MLNEIKSDADSRMGKSIESLRQELSKIRTGRAHPSLLDHIQVEYYGNMVPVNQAANVTTEDARTLVVTPWEKPMVSVIEKAILSSDLGLNPTTVGTVIRVPLPALTEERRRELTKVVHGEGENAKIAIRNIRRDANSKLKELQKAKEISEDEERRGESEVQTVTDRYVGKVDEVVKEKEQELLSL
ncbi:MAG: ribosome recycling factor [Xanthomonadales bacterium]|jgi:ribosome recycling factor|nr:ribosome recycling factor [Xanthomonadales bacterium]